MAPVISRRTQSAADQADYHSGSELSGKPDVLADPLDGTGPYRVVRIRERETIDSGCHAGPQRRDGEHVVGHPLFHASGIDIGGAPQMEIDPLAIQSSRQVKGAADVALK
jgi:hypothetical protein